MKGKFTFWVQCFAVVLLGCALSTAHAARCSDTHHSSPLTRTTPRVASDDFTALAPNAITLSFTHGNATCYNSKNGYASVTATGGIAPYAYLWNNGKTTQTITNIGAGTYTVTVTDATGVSASGSVTVTQPSAIIAYTNCVKTCPGTCSGTATITATGGTPPYTYHWANGNTTNQLVNLCAGVYWVTVTDAHNCHKILAAAVSAYPGINISGTATNPTCAGNSCNGSITQTITGGTPAYHFLWNSGATTQNRTGLCAGTYNVTVTDSKGCSATHSYTLVAPSPFTVTVTPTSPVCAGATGYACVTTEGGAAPFQYVWSNGATGSACVYNLATGAISVTVTSASGCTATGSGTINPGPAAYSVSVTSTPTICNTATCSGTASATPTGGTAPYTYHWNNNATTASLTGLCAGTYNVTVYDVNQCSAVGTVDVICTPPPPCNPPIQIVGTPVCGQTSVTLSITGVPNPATAIYAWYNSTDSTTIIGTTATLPVTANGTYCVHVTDLVSPCQSSACHTVTFPSAPSLTFTHTNATCYGGHNGSATVTATGGTTPYTYLWSNGKTTQTISTLSAGTYYVTVTSAGGCSATGNVTITQPPAIVAYANCSHTCYGACSATAVVTVTGGTAPYTYHWSNGATTNSLAGLCAGVYWLTITDAHGCTKILAASVTASPALVVHSTHVNPSCNGVCNGTITLTVSGGTAPYHYHWNNGATTQNRTGLCGGIYNVTVTDLAGCTAGHADTLVAPAPFSCSVTGPENVCSGGSAQLCATAGSGFTYHWSNNATTTCITVTASGTYTVTVTNATGCTSVCNHFITVGNGITVTATPTNVTCHGLCNGSISTSINGGTQPYTYHWYNGAMTASISGLCPGTYGVTVTDANNCSGTSSATITQPDSLYSTYTSSNILCYGDSAGTITVTPHGGTTAYTIHWNNGSSDWTLENLIAGTYCYTVTDAHQCVSTNCVTLTQPDSQLLAYLTCPIMVCPGMCNAILNVYIQGGVPPYAVTWYDSLNNVLGTTTTTDSATIGNLCAGLYHVVIVDANGCVDVEYHVIEETPAPTLSTVVTQPTVCTGACNGAIDLTVSGGTSPYTIVWNNGATTEDLANLCAGSYGVTVTDEMGCTASTGDSLITLACPPCSLTETITPTNVTCNDACNGSATVTTTGGTAPISYLWSNGATTATVTGLCAATYHVTVYDANQCVKFDSVTITEPDELDANLVHTDVMCYGDSTGTIGVTPLGGTAPYTILWDNGATDFNLEGLTAGTYCFTITDFNQCTFSGCTTIMQPDSQLLAYTVCPAVPMCTGTCNGIIYVVAFGGVPPYTYAWSTGDTTAVVDSLCPGIYTVTVTDANGCQFVVTHEIEAGMSPTLSTAVTQPTVCTGACNGAIDLTVSGGTAPFTFDWNTAASSEDLANLCPGTYSVTVTDSAGCVASITDTLTSLNCPPCNLSATGTTTNDSNCADSICNGTIIITTTGGTAPFTYYWSDGTSGTSATRTGVCVGTYSVTIADANQCNTVVTALVVNCIMPPGCVPLVTVTQGGWGAEPHGQNPGAYLHANFDAAFPTGITLGCNNTLTFTSAQAITDWLPSGTTPAVLPSGNITDPTGSSYNNVFAAQLLAATLNVGFDYYDSTFAAGSNNLGNMYITTGTFAGWTVNQLLAEANAVIGGCDSSYTPQQLSDALDALNNNYDDGDNGFLTCDTVPVVCNLEASINGPTGGCVGDFATLVALPNGATYLWSNGATDQIITVGLAAGANVYSVTVTQTTNATTCVDSATTTVTGTTPPTVTATSTPTTNCTADCNGTISLNVTGGTMPYSFDWTPDEGNNQNLTGLCAGDYSVTVEDANGCTATTADEVITINCVPNPCNLTASIDAPTEQCIAEGNATLTASPSGAIYMWSNGATTQSISVALVDGANNFSVTVTLPNNVGDCVDTAYATITGHMCCPLTTGGTITGDTSGCGTVCPGTLGIGGTLPSGGSGTIEYMWLYNNHASSVFYLGDTSWHMIPNSDTAYYNPGCLTSSRWFLRCSRRAGCSDYNGESNVVAVIVYPIPVLSTTATPTTNCTANCNGAIDLTVTGGTPDFTYNWSNNATTEDLTGLCAGTYTVTVTDANGCTVNTDNEVTTINCVPNCNLSASANTTNDSNCLDNVCDGAITLTLTGGTAPYMYNWNNTMTTASLTGICAGSYAVTVTDVNGCTAADTSINVSCTPPPTNCTGFTTVTQGGWGAVPNGHNPATLLYANFNTAFPGGVVIGGCGHTLTLTSAQAVTDFLPSTTTPGTLPAGNMINPGNTYANVFAGQVEALTLTIGLDNAVDSFSANTVHVADLYYNDPTSPFYGWTVQAILDTANRVLGGCPSAYTAAQLNQVLDIINNNYDGTSDNGHLQCTPPAGLRQSERASVQSGNVTISAYPNPFNANSTIAFTLAKDDNVTLEVYTVTGVKVAELFKGTATANRTYTTTLDGSNLSDGMYIYRLVTSGGNFTGNIVRVK